MMLPGAACLSTTRNRVKCAPLASRNPERTRPTHPGCMTERVSYFAEVDRLHWMGIVDFFGRCWKSCILNPKLFAPAPIPADIAGAWLTPHRRRDAVRSMCRAVDYGVHGNLVGGGPTVG